MKVSKWIFGVSAILVFFAWVVLVFLTSETCDIIQVGNTIEMGQGWTQYPQMALVCEPPKIIMSFEEVTRIGIFACVCCLVLAGIYIRNNLID